MNIMQEQPPYKITPDHAWAKMLPVLDKAMPVEKRSRRVIAFWWSAAAVFFIAVLSIINMMDYYQTRAKEQLITAVPTEQKENSSNENQTANTETVTSTIEKASDEVKSIVPDVVSSTTISNSTSNISSSGISIKSKRTQQTDVVTPNAPSADNISGNSTIATVISEEKEIAEPTILNEINAPQNHEEVVLQNVDITSQDVMVRNEMQVIDILPSIDLLAFEAELSQVPVLAYQEIKKSKSKEKFFSPFISAGTLQGLQNGMSIHAGAGAEVRLTRKLSLSAGLNYGVFHPGFSLLKQNGAEDFQSGNLLLNNEAIGDYLDSNAIANARASDLNLYVDDISQWQIKASLKYKFLKRLYAEAGISMEIGNKGQSQYPIVSLDYLADPLTADFNNTSHSLNSLKVIRRHTTSLFGGVGYKVGKKFDLYAQWMHGLDTYLISEPSNLMDDHRTDYIRGLNVGMKYFL